MLNVYLHFKSSDWSECMCTHASWLDVSGLVDEFWFTKHWSKRCCVDISAHDQIIDVTGWSPGRKVIQSGELETSRPFMGSKESNLENKQNLIVRELP